MRFVKNAAGRMVPTAVNGRRLRPYAGPFATPPDDWTAPPSKGHPVKPGESKVVDSVRKAIKLLALFIG